MKNETKAGFQLKLVFLGNEHVVDRATGGLRPSPKTGVMMRASASEKTCI